MCYFINNDRQGRMPVPLNGTAGLEDAIKNTTIGDQGLINELSKLQTYPSPLMYCTYHNGSSVTGVSSTILFVNFNIAQS